MKKITEVLNKLPHVHNFEIPMVADSTNEVSVDIPTLLRNGNGWHIIRVEMTFENTDPTVPFGPFSSTSAMHQLQLHRNLSNTTMLSVDDDDLLVQMAKGIPTSTTAGGTIDYPLSINVDTVTTQPRLRALFRTNVDNTYLSLTTVVLKGKIFFHKLDGPKNAGFTKHGLMKEL